MRVKQEKVIQVLKNFYGAKKHKIMKKEYYINYWFYYVNKEAK